MCRFSNCASPNKSTPQAAGLSVQINEHPLFMHLRESSKNELAQIKPHSPGNQLQKSTCDSLILKMLDQWGWWQHIKTETMPAVNKGKEYDLFLGYYEGTDDRF
jgi:hypothetical protein